MVLLVVPHLRRRRDQYQLTFQPHHKILPWSPKQDLQSLNPHPQRYQEAVQVAPEEVKETVIVVAKATGIAFGNGIVRVLHARPTMIAETLLAVSTTCAPKPCRFPIMNNVLD